MASSPKFVLYVCEQMSLAGEIAGKKMFGDYALYCDGKIIGLICDNQVYIKQTSAAERVLPDAQRLPLYDGAKPQVVLEELDEKEFLASFISATCAELPATKRKKA